MMLQNTDKRRYMAYKPTKIIGFYREDVENQTPRGIELEEICKEAAFGFFFEMLDDGQITATEVADLMKLPVEEVEQEYQEYRGYQSKCPYFKSRCPLFKCEYPHFKSECPFFKKKCPLA